MPFLQVRELASDVWIDLSRILKFINCVNGVPITCVPFY